LNFNLICFVFCSNLKYRTENGSVVFFVLGADTADALKSISRRITTPTGMKLVILGNRSAIPPTPINEELTQTIKTVMSNRYNAETKIMDLSKFREDINLQQLGLYVPLSRPNMLNAVIKIIIENTPDFIGLNLRDNKLTSLEPLVSLINVCPNLKAIDLSLNQVIISKDFLIF
jgi:nuclear RNA export factor